MKTRLLGTVAAIGLGAMAFGSPAHAVLMPAPSDFLTLSAPGTATFTFQGKSADDTDVMQISIDGAPVAVFSNQVAPGTTFTHALSAGTHAVTLVDETVPATWHVGPAGNIDNQVHLDQTTNFADFGIGAPATTASVYYGWEDRFIPGGALTDFNDLTFSVVVTPEPASLALLGAGLIGVGLMRRRRKTV